MARRAGRGELVYPGRHVRVWFELDRRGIQACAVGPELAAATRACATREAMPYAIRISPRSNNNEPGHKHYQDSFHVETVYTGLTPPESIGRPPMLRVGARLVNTAPHAAALEWGNKIAKGRRILGRTLDHMSRPRPRERQF